MLNNGRFVRTAEAQQQPQQTDRMGMTQKIARAAFINIQSLEPGGKEGIQLRESRVRRIADMVAQGLQQGDAVTPGRIRDFGERMQAQILRRDVHRHAFPVHIAQNMGTVQRMGGKKHVDRDAGNILFLP